MPSSPELKKLKLKEHKLEKKTQNTHQRGT